MHLPSARRTGAVQVLVLGGGLCSRLCPAAIAPGCSGCRQREGLWSTLLGVLIGASLLDHPWQTVCRQVGDNLVFGCGCGAPAALALAHGLQTEVQALWAHSPGQPLGPQQASGREKEAS